jgi:pantothenate kinase
MELPPVPLQALERLQAMLQRPGRLLLGIAGPPGTGKSSLAQALQQALGDSPATQVVPMDGFHLANCELDRRGLAHCKGAPETFDAAGFVALLHRLRDAGPDETVMAPEFRRSIEEPVAGAIAVLPTTRLVIVEGNYLLLPVGEWAAVGPLIDDTWYLETDDSLRRARLVERHRQFGRSGAAAEAWVDQTDEPNARLIAAHRGRAQWTLRWEAP